MSSFRIKKPHLWAFMGVVIYKTGLDLIYCHIISQVWKYEGFVLQINNTKFIESYVLLIVIFFMLQKRHRKVSNIIIWLLILFSFVPMLTIYAFKDESRIYIYSVTLFWILITLLSRVPSLQFPVLKQKNILLQSVCIGLYLIGVLLVFRHVDLSFDIFDLRKVYETRVKYMETGLIFLAGYVLTWIGYVVNPLCLVEFVRKERWWYAFGVIVFQLLIFSATGIKAFLYSPLFVLGVIWGLGRRNPLMWFAFGMAGGTLVGMLSYWLAEDIWASFIFAERGLLDPAQLSFFYYDFFSNHEKIYLSSHRIFGSFVEYPYHLDPAHLISEVYFDRPEGNANSGIVADGYMNFGVLGLVVWGISLVTILKLIDGLASRKNLVRSVTPVLVPIIVGVTNCPLLTTLFTHGLLLGVFFLWLLPRDKRDLDSGIDSRPHSR